MAVENEKMKNYTEKKTTKKTKQESSDESSGPVVKKRKKTKAVKEEDPNEENVNSGDIVKGKSSVLSKSIIESDDETDDNIEPVSQGASEEEMPDFIQAKSSKTIIESDED